MSAHGSTSYSESSVDSVRGFPMIVPGFSAGTPIFPFYAYRPSLEWTVTVVVSYATKEDLEGQSSDTSSFGSSVVSEKEMCDQATMSCLEDQCDSSDSGSSESSLDATEEEICDRATMSTIPESPAELSDTSRGKAMKVSSKGSSGRFSNVKAKIYTEAPFVSQKEHEALKQNKLERRLSRASSVSSEALKQEKLERRLSRASSVSSVSSIRWC